MRNITYEVLYYGDDKYRVMEKLELSGMDLETETGALLGSQVVAERQVFSGSISDCEAFIRLKEKGYLQ